MGSGTPQAFHLGHGCSAVFPRLPGRAKGKRSVRPIDTSQGQFLGPSQWTTMIHAPNL